MVTVGPSSGTRLNTRLVAKGTLGFVTSPLALVIARLKWLVAKTSATNLLDVARDVVADFVIANARLGSEIHARRTLVAPMAVVRDRVVAVVSTIAEVRAIERLSAASDGRILNGLAAVANSFIEIGDQTT